MERKLFRVFCLGMLILLHSKGSFSQIDTSEVKMMNKLGKSKNTQIDSSELRVNSLLHQKKSFILQQRLAYIQLFYQALVRLTTKSIGRLVSSEPEQQLWFIHINLARRIIVCTRMN
jgi:hypothetical protein